MEYYRYGDEDFSDYYYREKIGCFKLMLLCLRYGFLDTLRKGADVVFDTGDCFSKNLCTVLFSVLSFSAIVISVLSILCLWAGLYLFIPMSVLVTVLISSVAALLVLCICNAGIEYLKVKNPVTITLYACKLSHETLFHKIDKIHFHQFSEPFGISLGHTEVPTSREIKDSGIDLTRIPRSLLFDPHK